ncbi:hypothetical protein I553_2488 [Mycobacterium xenopi 4042]|uniref:Uncharacterized protein n=1 Tax=Mycobacterium xenopi 4042 TaxID=1299334 RepID=X8C7J5_MYCXE|nr:hypothetical protein I553_2488 [Mycobacterium xenopi 4042]
MVTLSSMMLLGAASPLSSLGESGTRSSGISVGSLVSGQTVIDEVASNRSSWTMTTGRGLPA